MQVDVRQQGRYHPALRRPLARAVPLLRLAPVPARFHDWGLQPHPDQLQYAPVYHSHPQTRHQLVVRYRIEVALQVRVVHRLIARFQMPANLLQRLLRRAVGTEPIGAIFKVSFEDRLQDQQGCHLHHPVSHRRYSQRSHLSVGFRYVHAAHWLRLVGLAFARLPGSLPETRSLPLPALPFWIETPSTPGAPRLARTRLQASPVCPPDRSGRTAHKTGTSVPASPSAAASVSAKRVSPHPATLSAPPVPGSSVVGFPKRFSFPLTSACFQRGPLAPSALPEFLATMGLSDSRLGPPTVIVFPLAVAACRHAAPRRVSQVPRLICPCALPPLTPGSPATAFTPCFIAGVRLHPYQADCPLPSRNEAETGSLALRLAGSPFEASPNGLPRPTLDWLHVEWAIYMVSSFHLTRSARLGLAHRMNADEQNPACPITTIPASARS
jgi:hypothetical protein